MPDLEALIRKLEADGELQNARASVADCTQQDDGLYDLGWYLGWNANEKNATLDGLFSAADLIAIAEHMIVKARAAR